MLSAGVDAVNDKGKFIEVKTCFEHKLASKIPQAWLQSYLGKVDLLVFGWKDRNGIVFSNPVEFPIESIAGSQVLQESDANAMLGMIGDVIDWLCTTLPKSNSTWLLEYLGDTQIILSRRSDHVFLPDWYTDSIDRKNNSNLVDDLTNLYLK